MWESFEHSLHEFLLQILASPQYFRLTIDLKKLKFVAPLCERVTEDRDYVDSISLSYLTSPVFKSNDVFHAVNARPNVRDPAELLITDGFCSFRFEDRLLWTDFIKLFVPSLEKPSAVLPIYVRARQEMEKCSTIGVATLNFASFLSPDKAVSLKDLPQLFFLTCLQSSEGPPPGGTPRVADLPMFEILLKLPVISKETAAMVAMLTLGIAIDVMNITIQLRGPPIDKCDLRALAFLSGGKSESREIKEKQSIAQVVSAPSASRTADDELMLMNRCFTEMEHPMRTGFARQNLGNVIKPRASQLVSNGSSPSGDGESSHVAAAGKDHLIQCEMMLLKLNAEQAHQKFRDEVKIIEAKSEERIEAIRKENQKLRNENRQLEKKLVEFEQKLQLLQDTIVRPPPCSHSCTTTSSTDALRRENERLQVLLKAERQKLGGMSAESDAGVPHAHSVHPVYHQPDRKVYRAGGKTSTKQHGPTSSSSSSNTDSSPLSSRSRQLLAFHLKRST